MKQSVIVNLIITSYVTALFIFFQPTIFPFDLANLLGSTITGDSYYMSILFRFLLFLGVSILTMPVAYYLVDHYPHHPDP